MKRKRMRYGFGKLKVGQRRNIRIKDKHKARNAAYTMATYHGWSIKTKTTAQGISVTRVS